jgi:hypothetical protein
MPANRLTEPGIFERSYRGVHGRAKGDARRSFEVIMRIRRAALVAQIVRERKQREGK